MNMPINTSLAKAEASDNNSLFLKSLVPVTLNSMEMDKFYSIYYPGNTGTSPKHGDLYEVMYQLHTIATGVNAAYAILRRLYQLNNASIMYGYGTDRLQVEVESVVTNTINAYRMEIDSKFSDYIKHFRSDISSNGGGFIIKPSKKFKGGFLVNWVGQPNSRHGASALMGGHPRSVSMSCVDALEYVASKQYMSSYNDYFKKYTVNDVAKEIGAVVETLNRILTRGAANDLATAHRRTILGMPFDFNFEQINDISIDSLKCRPFKDLFVNITPSLYESVKEYYGISLVLNPPKAIVNAKVQNLKNSTLFKPEDAIVPEIFRSHPDIGFSIVMQIPENYSHYVTQTPAHEQVSMVSLTQWVNSWMPYGFSTPSLKPKNLDLAEVAKAHYVVSPKLLSGLGDKRKAAGHYVENGNSDKNNIMVTGNGTLTYCPKASDLAAIQENAINYEKLSNEALQYFYDNNLPPRFSSSVVDEVIAAENDSIEPITKLKEYIHKVSSTEGTLLAGTWDYNKLVVSGKHPGTTKTLDISGTVPDDLVIADYLDRPFLHGVRLLTSVVPEKQTRYETPAAQGVQYGTNENTIARMYTTLYKEGLVKSVQELLNEAKAHFNIKGLSDEKISDYESNIYYSTIKTELVEHEHLQSMDEGSKIIKILNQVYTQCSGGYGTSLAQAVEKQFFDPSTGKTDYEAAQAEILNGNRMFRATRLNKHDKSEKLSKLADYKNVYSWVGGYVYYLALCEIANVEFKKLYAVRGDNDFPGAITLSKEVMPYIMVLTRYVPESDNILRRAEDLKKKNVPLKNFSIDDLKVQGTTDSAQAFPHQEKTESVLINHPKFAVLDCQAGGGKTISTCIDVAETLRHELINKVDIKPLIIAPDSLVKNWCEDFQRIVGSNWNYIPITTDVVKRWGFEKLDALIRNAPPNTLVIVGMNFISKAKKYSIVIGGEVETGSFAVEFIKNFGFNYIAIDEAHRVKNMATNTHSFIKKLVNMSNVRYVRLLSGTIIPNTTEDIVGIAGMFSGHIFRTKGDFRRKEAERSAKVNTEVGIKRAGGQLVRDRFKETCALVTTKRKEWAFMLPSPIEQFIAVYMSYGEEEMRDEDKRVAAPSREDEVLSNLHKQIYNKVISEAFRDMIAKLEKEKGKDDLDEDEAIESLLSSEAGEYYFQRIDRIVMDPESDPYGAEVFENARKGVAPDGTPIPGGPINTDKYVPRKIIEIIKRLNLHFTEIPWRRGSTYDPLAIVTDVFDGQKKFYSAVKHGNGIKIQSDIPPHKDTVNWKEEEPGKVLIITRYNESVNALLRNMPEQYVSQTVTLYGDNEKETNAINFNAFARDPNVKILIANEQRVSEGFNLQYCFPAQTQVLIDYNKSMSIAEVYDNKNIDHILSYNLSTRKIESRKIINKWRYKVRDTDRYLNVQVMDNRSKEKSTLLMTDNHPVFLKGGKEVAASELVVGDQLITYGGNFDVHKYCPITNAVLAKGDWAKYRTKNFPCPECDELMPSNAIKKHLYVEHCIGKEAYMEERTNRSEATSRRYEDPEQLEIHCERMRKVGNDPSRAEARRLQGLQTWENDDGSRREAMSERMLQLWSDPKHKRERADKISQAMLEYYASDEGKQSIADKLERYYEDDEARLAASIRQTEVQNRPHLRQLHENATREMCGDVVTRKRIVNSMRKTNATEERKAKRIAATKRRHAEVEGFTENSIRAMLKAQFVLPNKPERAVIDLEVDNLLYTGDGEYWVTLTMFGKQVKKNPDFISLNHSTKNSRTLRVVEVIGARDFTGRDAAYDEELISAYAECGIECLIIESLDCLTEDGLVDVKARLESFINNHYLTVTFISEGKSKKLIGEYKYDFEVEHNHNYFACAGSSDPHLPLIPVLVHNCSRIIRAEAPWTPGALEQTNSRIFRPDPAGFLNGNMKRNVVFLDWIIANNTLEMIKMAKLYRKVVLNCQYDESDNTDGEGGTNLYASIMEYNPPQVLLSKFNVADLHTLDTYRESHMKPYQEYAEIRNADFERMRKEGKSAMLSLPKILAPTSFKKIAMVPYSYGQSIPDPYNFQFEDFSLFVAEARNKKYLESIKKYIAGDHDGLKASMDKKTNSTVNVPVDRLPLFKGKAVHYEGGYGYIESLGLQYIAKPKKNKDGTFTERTEKAVPVNYINIRTADGQLASVKLSETPVFIINNLDESNIAIFKNSKSILTREEARGKNKPEVEDYEYEDNIDEVVDEVVPVEDDDDDMEEVTPASVKKRKGAVTEESEEEVTETEDEPSEESEEEVTPEPVVEAKPIVRLVPAVYNQYVALEIVGDEPERIHELLSVNLKGLQAERIGDYAYIDVHNKDSLKRIVNFLRERFDLTVPSFEAVKAVIGSSFKSDDASFTAETTSFASFNTFHTMAHKPAKKGTLKVYPLVSNGTLQLVVDLATNLEFKAKILSKGTIIPDLNNKGDKKFRVADGMEIIVVKDKQKLATAIKAIAASKLFVIENSSTLREEFDALKLHQGV